MTPMAKVSRPSTASPLAGAGAGVILTVGFLGIGVAGYLLVGPTPVGSNLPVLWTAIAIVAGSAVVLRRPNQLPDSVAPWVSPALVGPIALFPLFAPVLVQGLIDTSLAAAVLLAATLPMVIAIARLSPGDTGNLVRSAVAALGMAAILLIILPVTSSEAVAGPAGAPEASFASAAGWAARLAVLAVLAWPSAVAFTVLLRRQRVTGSRPAGEVLGDAALLVAAIGPIVTGSVLFIPWIYALPLIGLAALAVFAAFRVAVRPLEAISARAAAQRDLAISASEAERARLAADLHDGPLQDLLILARSLEARQDADGARLARDVADELRELSGDLRLPVLDDLGAGPALEWLAARVRRLTSLDVAADWDGDGRAPRNVELVAFRIAQEAVSNAVKHGRPPIRIRCRSAADRLRLTIEDRGDGHGLDSPGNGSAPDSLRRGIVGMGQRAEQIGGSLEVRRRDGLGTLVVLEWEAASG